MSWTLHCCCTCLFWSVGPFVHIPPLPYYTNGIAAYCAQHHIVAIGGHYIVGSEGFSFDGRV